MIKRLHIENYQSHADTTIELSPTVTVFTGESNQGKTVIMRALRKLLRNVPLGTFFIRWGQKTCTVSADIDGVEVTRIVGEGGKNTCNVGDTPFNNFGINLPEEVKQALDISDIQVFDKEKIDFNIRTQHAGLFLIGSSGVETLRGKIFGRVTGSEQINGAVTSLNSIVRSRKQEHESLKERFDTLGEEVKTLAYVYFLDTLLQQIDALVLQYQNLANTVTALKAIQTEYDILTVEQDTLSAQLALYTQIDINDAKKLCDRYLQLFDLFRDLKVVHGEIKRLKPIAEIDVTSATVLLESAIALSIQIQALQNLKVDLDIVRTALDFGEKTHKQATDAHIVAVEQFEELKHTLGVCPTCDKPF